MEDKIIEIEADTLEEARKQALDKVPDGMNILQERVICHEKPVFRERYGNTIEEAFKYAREFLPSEAIILDEKEILQPGPKSFEITAENLSDAYRKIQKDYGSSVEVKDIKVISASKKGFLGIGRKPNRYKIDAYQRAKVEITYKTNAKISVKIGEKTTCPKCKGALLETKGSPVSPHINTYSCSNCGWRGLRCGERSCDGYLIAEERGYRDSVRYRCHRCSWTGTGIRLHI